jgi:hypothetical protein
MKFDANHLNVVPFGQKIFGVGEDLGKCYVKTVRPDPKSWLWQEYIMETDGSLTPGPMRSVEHMLDRDLEPKKPRNADGAYRRGKR